MSASKQNFRFNLWWLIRQKKNVCGREGVAKSDGVATKDYVDRKIAELKVEMVELEARLTWYITTSTGIIIIGVLAILN